MSGAGIASPATDKRPRPTMGTFKLLCRDVIEALRPLPPNLFHGALCDPPYGLSKNGSAGGFMGKRWDAKVPGPEYWSEVLRVLKPGAPILACGGTRTYHRLACAIEDAGFEIFDSILGSVWIQGQGFPKSMAIDCAIDKHFRAVREAVGTRVYAGGHVQRSSADKLEPPIGTFKRTQDDRLVTVPATTEATAWNGYGTALKPSWEPIVFARKPLSGTYAENCIEHGCGGLNIDGSRISTSEALQGSTVRNDIRGGKYAQGHKPNPGDIPQYVQSAGGRYPANLILSHHPGCSPLGTCRVPPRGGDIKPNSKGAGPRSNQVYGQDTSDRGEWTAYKGEDGLEEVEAWECHPECPVAALDRQSGPRQAGRRPRVRNINTKQYGGFTRGQSDLQGEELGGGGASRFFYASKVSTAERQAGVDSLETIGVYSSTWEDEDLLVARVITDTSQNRVIGVSSTPYNNVNDWSTFLFGRHITDELCLQVITSTIETETDSIIASRTLSFLHSLITSGLTHRTTGDRSPESGKSSARTAKNGSRPQLSFGISREVLGRIATAAPAGFAEWLTQSASVRLEFEGRGCRHNTLKPLALTTYLAKLILPPPHISSRLLVPFCGTGSEIAGALIAGWGHVVGIDNDPESIETAQLRIPGLIARGTK